MLLLWCHQSGIQNRLEIYTKFEKRSPFTSIVLDLAATLFTPETPSVFYVLNTTHPSISIVVSR